MLDLNLHVEAECLVSGSRAQNSQIGIASSTPLLGLSVTTALGNLAKAADFPLQPGRTHSSRVPDMLPQPHSHTQEKALRGTQVPPSPYAILYYTILSYPILYYTILYDTILDYTDTDNNKHPVYERAHILGPYLLLGG